jgi:16S rRNA (guanine1516-N2)-methyltransferase
MGTIQNDFSRLTHRCRNSKKDPLFLATENIPRRVAIDRTAGFGGDAVFLASLGFEVHAWERHPSVFVFLKETEQWAHRQGFRLTAHRGEAPDQNLRAELVLLDPMFEETGSAKPSKKMQWLRSQAAPWSQKEWDDYLNLARRQAKSRVVLKAPPSTDLPGALPTSQIEGQSFSWQILKPF